MNLVNCSPYINDWVAKDHGNNSRDLTEPATADYYNH